MSRENSNITNIGDYRRKPLNMNIGLVILLLLFVYFIICVIGYFRTKHIVSYEVVKGSLSVSNVYEGIAIRQEEAYHASGAGYLNFFAREGEHVANGDLVYSIDGSGKISEMLSTQREEMLLSEEDLDSLQHQMIQFQKEFDKNHMSSAYTFQEQLASSTLKLSNYNVLDQLKMVSGSENADFVYAPKSGTVVFGSDGLEDLKPEDVTMALFEEKAERKAPASGDLVSADDFAYKLIDNENWSVVIPITPERAAELQEAEYVKVKFLKNQYESWARVTTLYNADSTFVQLDFTNSCITFAQDRYISLEVMLNQQEGLKVPNSSIITKDFFLIPKEYKLDSKGSKDGGFMQETYDEEGNPKTAFNDGKIYYADDDYYYVDTDRFKAGDRILMPDQAGSVYVISRMSTLEGVYNMNKGYADFTVITVLYQNEEYSIIKSNTKYGLSEYDFIVLDAASVKPDQLVFE
ncbi:MAG: hypothetical protein K6E84_07825 [Lachnospiraceae bacterium]|nr:hypothetical protein [Lachnospiraceae bacterium]